MKAKILEVYRRLSIPETNGKKIGLFRAICAIFGGLIVSYLGMTLLIYFIPGKPGESIIVPLLLNTFFWALSALWISVSPTKLSSFLRFLVPSIFFILILCVFYNI